MKISDLTQKTIEKLITAAGKKSKGLALFTGATGDGKSYWTRKALFNEILHPTTNKPYFFISQATKNLIISDILKDLRDSGMCIKPEECVLQVMDTATEFSTGYNYVPDAYRTPEYLIAVADINAGKQLSAKKERAYRKKLGDLLTAELEDEGVCPEKDTIKILQNMYKSEKYAWLFSLYPHLRIATAKVIGMTADRFIRPYDLIIGRERIKAIYEQTSVISSLRPVIVIDEIDAAAAVFRRKALSEVQYNAFPFRRSIGAACWSDDLIRYVDNLGSAEDELRALTDKYCVIGLSATADCKSCLSNFSCFPFRSYVTINGEELKQAYLEAYQNYYEGKIELRTSFPDYRNGFSGKALSDFPENLREIIGDICRGLPDFEQEYYLSVFRAICMVGLSDNIHTGLCVLSRLPVRDDSLGSFRFSALQDFANKVCDRLMIFCLGGDDYEIERKKYLEAAGNGEKVLALSTYPTVAYGQNLFYRRSNHALFTCDDKFYDEKDSRFSNQDIEYLYLGRITNIVPFISQYNKATDLVPESIGNGKRLEPEEFLNLLYSYRALYRNNEISRDMYEELLIYAYLKQHWMFYRPVFDEVDFGQKIEELYRNGLYRAASMKHTRMQLMIQALGRITRTYCHGATIYVDIARTYVKQTCFTNEDLQTKNPIVADVLRSILDYQDDEEKE